MIMCNSRHGLFESGRGKTADVNLIMEIITR
jgi:hypothetical protein